MLLCVLSKKKNIKSISHHAFVEKYNTPFASAQLVITIVDLNEKRDGENVI